MSHPTIYDVARLAGVSIKTVSRVINDAPNVRPATIAKVDQAIADLNYHPNPAAQGLSGGKLPTVGVVVDSIDDPFFAQVIAVIERRAMDVGMDVLVASSGLDGTRFETQIRRLVRRGAAGLIVAPMGDTATAQRALPTDVPVIIIDRTCGVEGCDVVRATDIEGARAATRHLLDNGHERIAFFGRTEMFTTVADRLAGFKAAHQEVGVEVDKALLETRPWSTDQAFPHAMTMLASPNPPTAVFASSPMVGRAILQSQQRLHRQDVALVVFGDFPMAELMTPPTTVVDQHPIEQANAAFNDLIVRREHPGATVRETRIETNLIERGSGELAPPKVNQ